MTTRHSLFTRCLSLVLAFVLVLGNMGGLAVPAKAASGTKLFGLITGSTTASNAVLRQILTYADVLPDLAAKNQEVAVAENPKEADGYIYNGVLTLKPVNGWEPYSYAVDGVKKLYTEPVEVGEDVFFASATYRTPVQGVDQQVQAVYNYVAEIGNYAYKQQEALNNISGTTAMSALSLMNRTFIEKMITAVEGLTVEDLEINPTAEELGIEITVQDLVNAGHIAAVEYTDVDGDGEITEADEAQINAEILANNQAAIDEELNKRIAEEIEKELAETKVEYVAIIKKMLNRLVEDPEDIYLNEYDDIYESFKSYLRVYAMLTNYNYDGLLHYYVNAKDIRVELKELSAVLWEILGEEKADGTYKNAAVVDAMLETMGYGDYGVSAVELGEMADRMDKAADVLADYSGYVDGMNTSNAAAVKALFVSVDQKGAFVKEATPLISQFQAAGLNPALYLESGELYVYPVYEEPTEPTEEPTEPSTEATEPSEEPTVPSEEPTEPSEEEPTEPEHVHDLVHIDAVAPGCHYTGNIEHWYCNDCDTVWADEALTKITNHQSVILPALGGEVEHFNAIEPACHYDGNVEYWMCYECEQVWTDEALTQLSNVKNVVLPALGGEATHIEAVEPACHYEGNVEYWICYECEKVWTDEALTQLSNIKNVVLPALGGEVAHVEAVAPRCHDEGNIEYWACAECKGVWADEALTQLTNIKNVILPALGGEVVHMEAIEPACHYDGQIEHWICYECEKVWQDEALTQLTNIKNVVVPATGGEVVHFNAVEKTCYTDGQIEHWICYECEQVWADEALTQLTNIKNVVLPAGHGEIIHVEAVAPSCEAEGNVEHWYCADCDTVWTDEALTQISNHKRVILPATHKNIVHVEAVAPSCYEEGNVEHWYCADCDMVWADEAMLQITNHKNVILPAACQSIVHVYAKASTCFEDGNIEHWYCSDCERFWQDAALTQLTNSKNVIIGAGCKTIRHVRAVTPTCTTEGNVKYWYCADCERFWLDAERTKVTNSKSVILPAACQNIKHVEAVAPTCFEEGNIEYWYCVDCETVWQDEAKLQITNFKNVVVPAAHGELVHVEAKAATCFENGNIEHWYCPDCGSAWLDAEGKMNTNLKAVVLPAGHGEMIHHPYKRAKCTPQGFVDGEIEHWECAVCGTKWTDKDQKNETEEVSILGTHMPSGVVNFIRRFFGRTGGSEIECAEFDCAYCQQSVSVPAENQTQVLKDATCTEEGLAQNVPTVVLNGVVFTAADTEVKTIIVEDENGEEKEIEANVDEASAALITEVVIEAKGHEFEHIAAVAAKCHEDGNYEYWHCLDPECDEYFLDAEQATPVAKEATIIPATKPDVFLMEGPCTTTHWTCFECDKCWLDEALTELVEDPSALTVHTVEHVAESCYNEEYWTCGKCETYWADEALTRITNAKNVIKAEPSHEIVAVEAVAPSCFEDGNIAYWYCEKCDGVWQNAELTQLTNFKRVVVPAGHNVTHVDAVAPGCHYEGNQEYWICYDCVTVWADEAQTQITNVKNVVIPATGSELLVHMDAIAPGCHMDGQIEHWVCYECEQVWTDEALTQLSNIKNVVLPATGSDLLVHMEAVEPGCHMNGNIEHWICYECEQVWTDEALTQLSNVKNVILPATGSENVTHFEAVAPACHYNGNVEYWFCADCEGYWTDEACTQVTNSKSVILPATGSNLLVEMDAVEPTCHDNGCIQHWICYECEQVWADEALTQLTNIKNVTLPALGSEQLVHMEAVAPACHFEGNIEYWVCYECQKVWQDEALTQLTNIKNVVLPATGEGNVVHYEAIAPGCHYDGQIEHWTCYDCKQVWQDEALTQLTNSKNVVVPAVGGETVHVDAVQPTFSQPGNIEYWYCEKCEKVWQDEALTQLTNIKNVNLAELGYCNTVEEPITDIELTYSEDFLTATATISVAPGGWYYGLYRMGEMVLTINGEEAEVTPGGFFYPSTFELINDTTEPMEVELLLYTPVGASSNPAELAMGENVAEVKAASNGYYFTWTAAEEGTLVLTMPEDADWFYVVNNMTSYVYGEQQWSDSDPVVNPAYIKVEAGDELQIIVNTYDPAAYEAPAGTLTVNAQFFAPVSVALWSANDFANTDWTQRSEAEGTAMFPIAGTYMVGDVLTLPDAQITNMVRSAEKAAANQHKTVDADALKAKLKDYVITADTVAYGKHYILVDLIPEKHEVLFDGKPVEVAARDDLQEDNITRDYFITGEDLGLEEGWIYFLETEGEKYVIHSDEQRIALNMDKFLTDSFEVKQYAERVNIEYDALSYLVNALNSEYADGAVGSFDIIEKNGEYTLVGNMTLGQVAAFADAIRTIEYEDKHDLYVGDTQPYYNMYLGVEGSMKAFLRNLGGGYEINFAALVNALLHDTEFNSDNMIKLAENGKGAFLHTTMNANGLFEVPFVLNLTSVPGAVADIGKALKALDGKLSFEANNGELNVNTIVPEKLYELYVAEAMITGGIGKNDPIALSNEVALKVMLDYVETLRQEDITFDTYLNTLSRLGVNKDLEAYRAYYNAIRPFISNKDKFDVAPAGENATVKLVTGKTDMDIIVAELMKGELKEKYELLREMIAPDAIDVTSNVTFTNKLPKFDAIVIDPTRVINKDFGVEDIQNRELGNIINDETSLTEKAMAYNMTTNLSAQMGSIYGASIIMLVGDVTGNLTFDHSTVLDLNGHNITGNIVANAPVVIIDSNLETVTGAVVDGSVSGDVTILSGNYTADVDAFLRDGYYQDKATRDVKNAMFEFNGTELVVDPSLYIANVDGYLPAAHYLAAEIGVDVVMNYLTGSALYANGRNAGDAAINKIYAIEFENLVGLLSNKGAAADAILACVDTEDLSDLINKILDDLVNVDKVAKALENRTVISTYNFLTYPWNVELKYVGKDNGDYLTLDIGASEVPTSTSISLVVDGDTDYVVNIPETDRQYTIQQILDELAEIVVTTDDNTEEGTQITVMINQPQRVGKTLVVGGSADAIINLDLHSNEAYNRVLGAILAYFNEDLTDDLVKNGCITGLNEAMSKVTVGDFFTAVKKAAEKEVPFEKIADKLELDLTAAQLKKLTAAYDKFQNTVAKTIARFELDTNASAPLSELADGTGNVIVSGDLKYHTADAYYKNFGVKVELDESSAKLILKLATSDEHVWDDGVVSVEPTCTEAGEMLYTCKYCDATKTEEIPVVDHVPGEAVIETVENNGKFRYFEVINCAVCGKELSRTQVYLMGDVNLDGKVTLADATMIYEKYILKMSELKEFNAIQKVLGNVNLRDEITLADATQIYEYALKVLNNTLVEEDWEPYFVSIEVE